MKQVLAFAFVAAFVAASATAQTQPQAQPQQQAATKGANPDEMVCQKQEDIGSRLSSHKICHTRAEWAQMQLDDRQGIEKIQTQRSMDGNGH